MYESQLPSGLKEIGASDPTGKVNIKEEITALTNILADSKLSGDNFTDEAPYTFVDSTEGVVSCLTALEGLVKQPPSIYVDLEGIHLSRHGSISILQIYVSEIKSTYLLDIHVMKEKAFSTPGTNGKTLKDVFEDEDIPKVFFDVRNDSDALFSHYGIKLAGIQDLQLMELASRTGRKTHVNGLARCIERDLPMTAKERDEWTSNKQKGLRLFAPEKGGSYEVFNARPLPADIAQYCAQDVHILPKLWSHYNRKLTPNWWIKVRASSRDRVAESQGPHFNGKGQHMAIGPWK